MSEITVDGGCLCGAVRYRISGEPVRFYHCHCERCRRATGTGHATNLMLTLGKAVWTRGEELLGHYKVPDAKRFATCFCHECGSSLPRVDTALGFAVIPAGSLDHEPELKPQARIFWDSRADWSCSGDALPTFPEYPPDRK